ncbi:MAG: type IV secretion system protein B4 [Nocardioides sp.]|nr:type IV secretion system protein B4 [Nocardioides sp.]
MRVNPIFRGLTRPAKFMGLPIGYLVSMLMAALIPYIGLNEWKFLLILPVVWPVLWFVSDRQPHLFEILGTVYSAMPPTRNRRLYGGDRYVPYVDTTTPGLSELLGKHVLKDEPSARHLPYLFALTDEIIVTRQGDLMASMIVDGIDSQTSDTRVNDAQADSFQKHISQFGENFGYYVNKITVPDTVDILENEGDPFSAEVDRRWRKHLTSRNLKKRVIMVSVILRPDLGEKVKFFGRRKQSQSYDVLRQRAELLDEAMRVLGNAIAVNSSFERLTVSGGDWLGLLAAIQGQPFKKRRAASDRLLCDVAAFSTFTFKNRTIEIDDGFNKRYGAMLGVHAYGPKSLPKMLDSLDLPYDVVITNSFTPLRSNVALQKMTLRNRQLKSAEDPAVSAQAELAEAADQVASGVKHFGYEQLSILITADSQAELDNAVSEVWQATRETDATIIRLRADTGIIKGPLSTVFFGQAPGNFSYRPHKAFLSGDNFADLSAFHRGQTGRSKDETPWGEAVTLLPTITSSLYRFNFHETGDRFSEPSAGHTLVLGRTNSGKTLGAAFLLSQARRVGARVIALDKDFGLEMAVKAMGGKHSAVRVGEPTGFNPFRTENDERGRAWLTDWLIDILGRDKPLSTVQTIALTEATREITAPDLDPDLKNFEGLASLVTSTDDKGDLLARVGEWCRHGRYDWLFSSDAVNPIALNEDVVGIDMSEILDMNAERTALLSYLFRRVERLIEDRRPTIIVIDEAWKMLNDPMFEKRLHDWFVTMRKKNCVVMMLTQTPGDLNKSAVGQIIAESASTQILYPNAQAEPEDYKILRLNPTERELLAQGSGGMRLALIRSGGDSVFVHFDLSTLGGALHVLGGGKKGEDKAPFDWRNQPDFWEKMV